MSCHRRKMRTGPRPPRRGRLCASAAPPFICRSREALCACCCNSIPTATCAFTPWQADEAQVVNVASSLDRLNVSESGQGSAPVDLTPLSGVPSLVLMVASARDLSNLPPSFALPAGVSNPNAVLQQTVSAANGVAARGEGMGGIRSCGCSKWAAVSAKS